MIKGAPLQYAEDDADAEEVQVLPILKFIEKKGQRIDGKITHLVKDGEGDNQTQLPSLIGIYNASDAAQTTIGDDACIPLAEMEQIRKKWQLNLVVESQQTHQNTAKMPAPYRPPMPSTENAANDEELNLSLPQMNTGSQMLKAVDQVGAPMKRQRATKQQVMDRRRLDELPDDDEMSERGLDVEGHQDVKLEDDDEENEAGSEYDSDGDDDNDSSDDGKRRDLKGKRAGVLLGRTKTEVN